MDKSGKASNHGAAAGFWLIRRADVLGSKPASKPRASRVASGSSGDDLPAPGRHPNQHRRGGLGEVGTTGQLVTVDQIRRWCGAAGSITIRPVIDLTTTTRATRSYEPTDVMRETPRTA